MAFNCYVLSRTEPFKYTASVGYTLEVTRKCLYCNWCSWNSGFKVIYQLDELTRSPDSENIACGNEFQITINLNN